VRCTLTCSQASDGVCNEVARLAGLRWGRIVIRCFVPIWSATWAGEGGGGLRCWPTPAPGPWWRPTPSSPQGPLTPSPETSNGDPQNLGHQRSVPDRVFYPLGPMTFLCRRVVKPYFLFPLPFGRCHQRCESSQCPRWSVCLRITKDFNKIRCTCRFVDFIDGLFKTTVYIQTCFIYEY
jgi:hypothetical protein